MRGLLSAFVNMIIQHGHVIVNSGDEIFLNFVVLLKGWAWILDIIDKTEG